MFLKKYLLIILTLTNLSESANLNSYCRRSQNNIPCKYRCIRGSLCGNTGDKYRPLTKKEREVVTLAHNKFRQMIASGEMEKKGFPKASNMNVISYDKECEFFSGCYIKTCLMSTAEALLPNGESLGQNWYTFSIPNEVALSGPILGKGITTWFKEMRNVKRTEIPNMLTDFKVKKSTRHFTQVMWADTKFVGCAMMHNLRDSPANTYDVFCHYRPAGNVEHGKLYVPGKKLTCEKNKDFPNLCGEIRPLADDLYDFPNELLGKRLIKKSGGCKVVFRKYWIILYFVWMACIIYKKF